MTTQSNLLGVFPATKKDGTAYFRASLTFRGKHISLGSFHAAEDAALAYKEGIFLLSSSTAIIDYSLTAALPFEKWVCLINFRDNGFYIANPIYVRPKMFYYYLSPSKILKFDSDELFYYISHKISQRGGHLYVADYGSQLSVLKRYGIKSYGISGKDFRFKNGDILDFRSGNLEILSSYHGVLAVTQNGVTRYKSRILVRGNYLIGTFGTEEEAAIAYNKAVDTLKAKGFKKAYPTNYLSGIRPSEYANIYASINLPEKILALSPASISSNSQ
ncbi:MAG: hypothetical protein MJ105_03550 [Lachnospiraceae bacterium]|nr:hypothetical protein [Lachnospiraceae bacterium]